MATPVFECLRQSYPKAIITACVRPYAKGILQDSPWFDHIIDCDDKSLEGITNLRRQLQQIKPQTGILLTNTTHSWLTFKIAGIPRIYGYKRNLRKYFLSGGPQPEMENGKVRPLPMQEYYLNICRYLGLGIPEKPRPSLYFSSHVAAQSEELLKTYGITASDKVVGLNPGASFGASKCWPAEYFAKLADTLQSELNCKLLLLVGPGEEKIAAAITSESKARIINTASDKIDLALLKPIIKRCNLLITNDTGPRHYAVAFNIPNIVLMGPTNPIYTATNSESSLILQRDLPCVPCHKKTCPLGHHACMREITPDMVSAQVRRILQET